MSAHPLKPAVKKGQKRSSSGVLKTTEVDTDARAVADADVLLLEIPDYNAPPYVQEREEDFTSNMAISMEEETTGQPQPQLKTAQAKKQPRYHTVKNLVCI